MLTAQADQPAPSLLGKQLTLVPQAGQSGDPTEEEIGSSPSPLDDQRPLCYPLHTKDPKCHMSMRSRRSNHYPQPRWTNLYNSKNKHHHSLHNTKTQLKGLSQPQERNHHWDWQLQSGGQNQVSSGRLGPPHLTPFHGSSCRQPQREEENFTMHVWLKWATDYRKGKWPSLKWKQRRSHGRRSRDERGEWTGHTHL